MRGGNPIPHPFKQEETPIETEKQKIQRFMKTLDLTEAEAKALIAEDAKVDKMKASEVDSDLTADQKQAVKKLKNSDTHVYKFDKRERKKDATKESMIADIAKYLSETAEFEAKNVKIVNSTQKIDFEFGGKSYSLTLTGHRK